MPPGRHLLGDFEVIVDATSARPGRRHAGRQHPVAGPGAAQPDRRHRLHAGRGAARPSRPRRREAIGLDGERGRIAPGYIGRHGPALVQTCAWQTTIASGEIVYSA
ncbi:MAG: hypothetical protein MZV63_23990 [Marinilabiliales bacterium]|nr:hypothetical protein [Marinilabiliales bacterium]